MSGRFDPSSLVGTVLGGRLRLVQHARQGGIGHVYVARPVGAAPGEGELAVKLLRPEHEGQLDLVARFEREAVAARRIRHENVLAVHGTVERAEGRTFFVMELLRGGDLADVLGATGRLPAARAVRVARGVARALEAAHAVGVIHRDVKPENVFLVHAPDGREVPKLVDFGSAWLEGDAVDGVGVRITARHGILGTPGYLAPEQARRAAAAPTADVYALGATLFEALAGQPVFPAETWVAVVGRHANDPVPPLPGVSPELEAVVRRALAKRPEERFPTAADLEAALAATPEAR